MIIHLIAAIFAGLGAAGVALLLRKLSGKRLPKWIIPAFAGLGMLGYQIYFEYSWFSHKQSLLPEHSVVISTEGRSDFWRPWTFIVPMTGAFIVLDESTLDVSKVEGQTTARFTLYRFEKHFQDLVVHSHYVLNCDLRDLVELPRTEAEPITRRRLTSDSVIYRSICLEER